MKRILYFLFFIGLMLNLTSCWEDDIERAGAARHQVENLKAVPGDEEVLLSWTIPDGWSPSDYKITYTDANSQTVTEYSHAETNYTVKNLQNDVNYTFSVQAIYGDLISGEQKAAAKPSTLRYPVSVIEAESSDQTVVLTWEKPSMLLLSYTLSYYREDATSDVVSKTIDKDLTTITIEDLVNDKNYYFSLVANYEKGASEPISVKSMPSLAIPYTLDRTTAAVNQPITFTFNKADYPTAENVTWTFPGSVNKAGEIVSYGFPSSGTQTIVLSADLKGKTKTWNLEVDIREYVVYNTSYEQDGTNYNGFKGTCPVFSPDGSTVYIITFNKIAALYAFDLMTGNEKWRFVPATKASSYNMLTVNPVTGDIYYGTTTAGQFYAVTSQGQLKWTFTEALSMQSTAPAVNAAGTEVYISDASGNTFALDAATGNKKWSYSAGAVGCGLLVNGDELLLGASKNIIFLNIHTGELIDKIAINYAMVTNTGFAVSNDKKTAFFSQAGGFMSSIDLSSHKLIVDALAVCTKDLYEPVVAPNGTVFVGSKAGYVYNLKSDLSAVNWNYLHAASATNAFNFSHPCVDSQNRFYITAGGSSNGSYIFDAAGKVLDSWTYESSDVNQKQMAGNNYLNGILFSCFIGSSTKNGIFVGKYVGGTNASSWSTHGGDLCGSCCIK